MEVFALPLVYSTLFSKGQMEDGTAPGTFKPNAINLVTVKSAYAGTRLTSFLPLHSSYYVWSSSGCRVSE